MQAKDFFHLASLRFGKQQGLGLTPLVENRLVSPDGKPVTAFSDVLPVDGGLDDPIMVIIPAFWDDFDTLISRYPQVGPGCAATCARASLRRSHRRVLAGRSRPARWQGSDHLLALLRPVRQRYPKVALNREKHITDADNLYCAGGVTSARDLYLY
jgi:transcriptional regulator GlxA family with amidase domain